MKTLNQILNNILNIFLVMLVLVVLVVSQPALADRPKLDQNPDYTEITAALDALIDARETQTPPEGMTLAEVKGNIASLQLQKYIMETAEEAGGICRNETGAPIAIYGAVPKKATSNYDAVLYSLPDGAETDDDWNCQGVYLSNDVKVAGVNLTGATAAKILAGSELIISKNPETEAIEFNLPPYKFLQSSDINWEIPDLTQDAISTTLLEAPID
jgi:hypothetical protein